MASGEQHGDEPGLELVDGRTVLKLNWEIRSMEKFHMAERGLSRTCPVKVVGGGWAGTNVVQRG